MDFQNKFSKSWTLIHLLVEEPKKKIGLFALKESRNKYIFPCIQEIAHNLLNDSVPLKKVEQDWVRSRKKKLKLFSRKGVPKKELIRLTEKNFGLIRRMLELSLPHLRTSSAASTSD